MRAAFYTRYSSDKQRESSIEDQFRNCERFAVREGWDIIPLHHEAEIVCDYAGLMSLAAKRPGATAGASEISVVAGVGFEPTTFRL